MKPVRRSWTNIKLNKYVQKWNCPRLVMTELFCRRLVQTCVWKSFLWGSCLARSYLQEANDRLWWKRCSAVVTPNGVWWKLWQTMERKCPNPVKQRSIHMFITRNTHQNFLDYIFFILNYYIIIIVQSVPWYNSRDRYGVTGGKMICFNPLSEYFNPLHYGNTYWHALCLLS